MRSIMGAAKYHIITEGAGDLYEYPVIRTIPVTTWQNYPDSEGIRITSSNGGHQYHRMSQAKWMRNLVRRLHFYHAATRRVSHHVGLPWVLQPAFVIATNMGM